MIKAIFGGTTRVLEQSIQLRMMRQGMLAANIANAETANYRAVDVDFRATMANLIGRERQVRQAEPVLELQRADSRHFSFDPLEREIGEEESSPIVFAAGDAPAIGSDNNTVALEQQMARMQMNATMHALLTRLYSKRVNGIKNLLESTSRY